MMGARVTWPTTMDASSSLFRRIARLTMLARLNMEP